jgi:hypothetical protein
MRPSTWKALGVFAVLLGLSVLAGAVAMGGGGRQVRDERNCFRDRAPMAVTAVLIDQSDRFTSMDTRRIGIVRGAILDGMTDQTLVTVAVLTDSPIEPVQWIAERCVDPEPRGGVLAYLTGNPKVQRAQWAKRSDAPLVALLAQASTAAPAEHRSFIGQAMFTLSRHADFAKAGDRRIVVFSDMLELSDTFSVYGGRAADIDTRLRAKPEWRDALKGFKVVVLRAYRPGRARLNALSDRYWAAYAKLSGSAPWTWL